jgi:DNA-binding CsgD family transcriptional regulator
MITVNDAHQKLVEIWAEYHPNAPDEEQVRQFVSQSMVLDHAEHTNLRTVIFSYHDFSICHINVGTARYFGSTPEAITATGPGYIMSCVSNPQMEAAIKNTQFIQRLMAGLDNSSWKKYQASYVNCNITCNQGNKHRSLFHAFPVLFNEKGLPLLGMFLIYDLEPFMTDGIWWYRYKVDDRVFLYHSEDLHMKEHDILSVRELEILKLIYGGASSKEIADQLFLSVNTVDNHRRNMLKKTGAIDTSALIHLCKMCQII